MFLSTWTIKYTKKFFFVSSFITTVNELIAGQWHETSRTLVSDQTLDKMNVLKSSS